MALVHTQVDGDTGTITLDNPARRNALSGELVGQLKAALRSMAARRLRTAVLRAPAGAEVWSSGHDVTELPITRRDPLCWDDPVREAVCEVQRFPAPVVAMVEGSVWGGACELVFACDLVVAARESCFAVTPARLGAPCDTTALANLLRAAGRCVLREMLFTADPIPAARAERLGMINHVVPREDLERTTYALCERIARNAPLSIAVFKEQCRLLESERSVQPSGQQRMEGLRREVYRSADYEEGISAFLEKREPEFRGN